MSKYRGFAKAVAIVHLILTGIILLCEIVLCILADIAVASKEALKNKIKETPDDYAVWVLKTPVWILIVSVVVYPIFTALQLWAVNTLLSATKTGRKPVEALRMASTWRNITVIFLILVVIGLLHLGLFILLAFNILVHGGMVYIVSRYMQELRVMPASVPVSVNVPI